MHQIDEVDANNKPISSRSIEETQTEQKRNLRKVIGGGYYYWLAAVVWLRRVKRI